MRGTCEYRGDDDGGDAGGAGGGGGGGVRVVMSGPNRLLVVRMSCPEGIRPTHLHWLPFVQHPQRRQCSLTVLASFTAACVTYKTFPGISESKSPMAPSSL